MTIPKDLQEAVERFRALCQADPRVVAAFVGGSLATGTADEYSDIDVYLIVVDEAYDSFFAERAVFMHLLKSFWRQLFLLNSALGRGWLLSAASYFEGMRRQLLHVCRLSVDFSASGDKPPLETLLPEQLVLGLGQTFPRLDREEMVAAVREAVCMFQRVAKPLAQTQGVLYPERLERVVRRSMRRHRHFDLWMHEKELMP